jgi:hypothetical protein
MAAETVQRSKTAIGAAYRRIAQHKGAAVAVIYRMLRYGQDYVDIGEKAYEDQFQARRLAALAESARSLDYALTKNEVATGQVSGQPTADSTLPDTVD